MARDAAVVVDNSFIGGLKTEFTGLNFPENSCAETVNMVFNKTGLVDRRLGFDYEDNFSLFTLNRNEKAINKFVWRNPTGDGTVTLLVVQIGRNLYFYRSSAATETAPLSAQRLTETVDLNDFRATGVSVLDETQEAQFAEGNGYLFVFHPQMDPIYVKFNPGTLDFESTRISIKVRDMTGIEVPYDDTLRPLSPTDLHKYNLANQGWGKGWAETALNETEINDSGDFVFNISSGLPIALGDRVRVSPTVEGKVTTNYMVGIVTEYTGAGSLTISVSESGGDGTFSSWNVMPEPALIQRWKGDVGNFPSNSDVWWRFINNDDFAPLEKINTVTNAAGPSPKGYYVIDAFNEDRSSVSGIEGLEVKATTQRPSTGTWFAGRVWYAGVKAPGYNEKIYFSQIIEKEAQFGKCFQVNDPTSSTLFDILPSDGGVLVLQGAGTIHKLFPIANGLLVFGERGVWFITGSQGIGFTATDYTPVHISDVPAISHTSFVNVQGMPFWWNEDGIYTMRVQESKMEVVSITKDTVDTFFKDIALRPKLFARGYFNPLTSRIQWLYRSAPTSNVTNRYNFSQVLNFDVRTGAFYTWSIANNSITTVNDIVVIGGTGGTLEPAPTFKYLTSTITGSSHVITFSEERDTGREYTSYIVTGPRVYGQGLKDFQVECIDVHAKGGATAQCLLEARWNNAITGNAGKWSTPMPIIFGGTDFNYVTKRRRIRGSGRTVQFKFTSVDQYPMPLIGWSTQISANKVP